MCSTKASHIIDFGRLRGRNVRSGMSITEARAQQGYHKLQTPQD